MRGAPVPPVRPAVNPVRLRCRSLVRRREGRPGDGDLMRVGADDGDEIHWRREPAREQHRCGLACPAEAGRRRRRDAARRSPGRPRTRRVPRRPQRAAGRCLLRAGPLRGGERRGRRRTAAERPPPRRDGSLDEGPSSPSARRCVRPPTPSAHTVPRVRPSTSTPYVNTGSATRLTDSLCQLVRGTEGVRITLLWAVSAGTPHGCPARPAPVVFTPGDLTALELAGRHYSAHEPSPRWTVTPAMCLYVVLWLASIVD